MKMIKSWEMRSLFGLFEIWRREERRKEKSKLSLKTLCLLQSLSG
jgi:hypothetical protein